MWKSFLSWILKNEDQVCTCYSRLSFGLRLHCDGWREYVVMLSQHLLRNFMSLLVRSLNVSSGQHFRRNEETHIAIT